MAELMVAAMAAEEERRVQERDTRQTFWPSRTVALGRLYEIYVAVPRKQELNKTKKRDRVLMNSKMNT